MITQTKRKQLNFLNKVVRSHVPDKKIMTAPEWAENKRILTSEYSRIPGRYKFKNSPFLREVLDCFSVNNSTREFAVMKGSQLGFTMGIIENAIGYIIDVAPAPMMYVTADRDLAKANIETRIDSMLQTSKMQNKIGSNTQKKHSHKTGDTATKKEFPGGFLIAVGSRNPNKMRMFSIKVLLCDEIDAAEVSKQGDPIDLAVKRTDTFETTRKIAYISTPLKEHNSNIYKRFLLGDQRKFFVPCPHCGGKQILEQGDGITKGLHFKKDGAGNLIEESVCYICKHCQEKIYEHHKRNMVNKGEWVPTAQAIKKGYRSYHLPAFYSLFYSWKECVYDFISSQENKVKLQVYYNNVLGLPWSDQSKKIDSGIFRNLIRPYAPGTVPNSLAEQDGNGKIVLLTCAVDVNGSPDKPKGYIDLEIVGHCLGKQTYSIGKLRIRGNTDSGGDAWQALHSVIEKIFYDDSPRRIPYNIQYTCVDSGNKQAAVFDFCSQYESRVSAIKGQAATQSRGFALFTLSKKQHTHKAYSVQVDSYKSQVADYLRKKWEVESTDQGPQPVGFMNFPNSLDENGFNESDFPSNTTAFLELDSGYDKKYFDQYTAEYVYQEVNEKTGNVVKLEWRKRNTRAQNHYWDCRIYNIAARDIFTHEVCEPVKIAPDWRTVANWFLEKIDEY